MEAHHGITREDLQRPMAAALRGPGLGARAGGLGRPGGSWRPGVCRILSGARAIRRPMVETLGRASPCCAHQGYNRTWSLALPKLG